VASRRKAAVVVPAEVRAPFLAEGEDGARHRRRIGLALGAVFVLAGAIIAAAGGRDAPAFMAGGLVLGAFLAGIGLIAAGEARGRARVRAARALIDAGAFEAAVVDLKDVSAGPGSRDEADYLVALAYDRQGATKLAAGCYRRYLEDHEDGRWAVEAKVRLEELDQAARVASIDVKGAKQGEDCPFCKCPVGDELSVECGACGTRHHMACYQEQGGCSVYGCASKGARVPVKDA
jgi:hypothetical protein